MSRREIVVNTLCGVVLLTIFTAIVGAILLPAFYLLGILSAWLDHLGVPRDIVLDGIMILLVLAVGIQHLRMKFWSNAVLTFALVPLVVLEEFTGVQDTGLGRGFIFVFLIIFFLPTGCPLRRREYVVGAVMVLSATALIVGVFGHAAVGRTIAYCICFAAAAWYVVLFWQGRLQGQKPSAPIS
jgi:hypothetical protein